MPLTPSSNDRHYLITAAENAAAPGIRAGRLGTVITIDVNEPAIDEVVGAGFDRLVLERSTNAGLSWSEITRPDTRPVLEVGAVDYKIRDATGDPAYQYRTRYLSSKKGECTQPSASVAGEGLAIQNLLTVAQLKARYLFGIDLTNDAGEELSDEVFRHYILSAIRWFETTVDISLLPTAFEEFHDYYRTDYYSFNFIALDNYPVQEITQFRVQYPSGQTVVTYPPEWIRLNGESGQIQIVPTSGTLSELLVGAGGSFLPAIYNGMEYLPQLFSFQYIAGFGTGQVPRNIIDIIGKFASFGPFNIFGDLIAGAGIGNLSLSLDGLSQTIGTTASATNAGYGARLKQYGDEIKREIPKLISYYKRAGRLVVA